MAAAALFLHAYVLRESLRGQPQLCRPLRVELSRAKLSARLRRVRGSTVKPILMKAPLNEVHGGLHLMLVSYMPLALANLRRQKRLTARCEGLRLTFVITALLSRVAPPLNGHASER